MENKDYYNTLGVSKDASLEEIKKAYRTLAKKYHPDLHRGDKGNEEKFKEINEAYKALSDPKTREGYDRFGSAGPQGGFSGHEGFGDFSGGGGFEDIFQSFFGGGRQRNGPRKGPNLEVGIEISLEEVAKGVKKSLRLEHDVVCNHCHGSGGEQVEQCSYCQGSGYVKTTRGTPFGIFATNAPCKRCQGTGKIIVKKCNECRGRGTISKTEKIEVEIPAGVHSGDMLRVSGKGEPGTNGGPQGDLIVHILVLEHELFKREGDNLILDIDVNYPTMVLGGKISVKTIEGEAELKIHSGTEDNSTFRMRNQGLPRMNGYGKGDLLVKVTIKVPKRINRKQKQLIEELESEL